MDVSIKGKGLNVGDALRSHIEDMIGATVGKYFANAVDASVTVSREASKFRADISVHPLGGVLVQAHGMAGDAYLAFDGALERIGKQLRRYKRRLTNHSTRRGSEEPMAALQYVMAPETADEVSEEGQPAIIAELSTVIESLSVGEAVMRMDLADAPVLMFRNHKSGAFNVIYRRSDGNIGWIDTETSQHS